ncbi:hypothetical protein TSUD_292870 [Trifolium subterraneum]|uniref:Integrase catalytic domain-containing protein n=1 Tax=Trifolium subterraneum TaxID=3900 RepID=A0A2Z6P121_TRISU|nr:hypothetical protein TSUD_292870 [Trifolium subterraneum]
MDREGGYVTRPPLLDDSNYDIWKARMIAFLKSIDSRTWKAVLKGWEHPKVKDANGADTDELKPEEDWTAAEDSLALGNSKALNALFNGVDKNMFRLIKKCEVAKDAWEILKTTQEGTAKVKVSRLQNLTRKFENLRMKEDESVHNFYMNVMDFADSFDDLGEKLSDEKIVRKILRSLTKKFDMKVIAMEEAQDISTMKVDELVGSLQTYESSVNERIEKKNKSIAFVLKRMDRRPRQNAKHLATDMSRSIGNSRKTKIDEKPAQSKGIQCRECEGYGHIRTECATYLKKQKKSLNVTWSDEDESEEEGESEVVKHVTVLTGIVTSDTESCDEEVSYDELAETYRDLCLVSEEKCKELEKQKKLNSQLQGLASDLDEANEEIDKLEVDIGRLRKYSEMLNKTGADTLDEILEKNVRRPKFTGISYENVNKHRSYNPELMYTQPKESPMSSKMLQHPKQHHGVRYKTKSHPWDVSSIPKIDETLNKDQVAGLIAHTSFRASSREDWYFDSGCSRHMTGIDKFLVDMKTYSTSFVTFGDGAKGEIVGIGKLINNSLPKLDNVLLVKGLTANLISISQLCDQGLKVNFTKTECLVTDDKGELLMNGVRSKDNCYLWVPQEDTSLSTCLIAKEDEVKLWHQRLAHLNLKSLKKAISEEAIRGLPKLKIEEGHICGECQIGKQTKTPHQKLHHLTTTRVLELLHMDLMGPMQVLSLGGKRYAYVVVDDFSRYTWINFIKEKSDTFDVSKDLRVQLQREKNEVILRIRSDHGKEFQNSRFSEFCASEGIKHEFSSPITPQQNGVVERKNRTLQESARAMLHAKKLSYSFWAEAMNTACYIHNRVTLRSGTTSTLYELWKNRKPTVKYFHVFGSKCYILTDREQRRKLDPKSDEGIFLGYSTNSRSNRVYNSRTKVMMESINVVIDDSAEGRSTDVADDAIASNKQSDESDLVKEDENNIDTSINTNSTSDLSKKGPSISVQKNHTQEFIIGDPSQGIATRSKNDVVSNACFVSKIEPRNVKEALADEYWINAMQEELGQFKRNEVWDLVPRPENVNVIGTKWVYKNKSDENGNITRNKARLVAQGYAQIEGVDFDETFAPVARLESIRLLLGVACILKFKLFQMDVKCNILNFHK